MMKSVGVKKSLSERVKNVEMRGKKKVNTPTSVAQWSRVRPYAGLNPYAASSILT